MTCLMPQIWYFILSALIFLVVSHRYHVTLLLSVWCRHVSLDGGQSSAESREPEESDELDYLPAKHKWFCTLATRQEGMLNREIIWGGAAQSSHLLNPLFCRYSYYCQYQKGSELTMSVMIPQSVVVNGWIQSLFDPNYSPQWSWCLCIGLNKSATEKSRVNQQWTAEVYVKVQHHYHHHPGITACTCEPEPQSEVTVITSMEGYSIRDTQWLWIKKPPLQCCRVGSSHGCVQGLVFSKPVWTLSLSLHSHLLKITAHILLTERLGTYVLCFFLFGKMSFFHHHALKVLYFIYFTDLTEINCFYEKHFWWTFVVLFCCGLWNFHYYCLQYLLWSHKELYLYGFSGL